MKPLHFILALALLILLPACDDGGGGGEKALYAKSFLGKKAPDLVVEKWLTTAPEMKGKFLLIDFWATWCPPCRKAIPELNGFQKKFADKLVVIGISNETEEVVRRMQAPLIEYVSAIDTEARMSKAVGVQGIPHCLLIDPDGIVRWEGFPFAEGHTLTEQVIADIVK